MKLEPLETLHERVAVREEDGTEEMFVCGLRLCSLRFGRYLRTHVEAFICILCGLCCHSDQLHPTKSEFICRNCGFFNRKSDQPPTSSRSVMYQ